SVGRGSDRSGRSGCTDVSRAPPHGQLDGSRVSRTAVQHSWKRQLFSRASQGPLTGTTDWVTQVTRLSLGSQQRAQTVRLNVADRGCGGGVGEQHPSCTSGTLDRIVSSSSEISVPSNNQLEQTRSAMASRRGPRCSTGCRRT